MASGLPFHGVERSLEIAHPFGGGQGDLRAVSRSVTSRLRWRCALPALVVSIGAAMAAGCSDNGGANLCYFDDQLVFIGANTLISRMIQSGLRLR